MDVLLLKLNKIIKRIQRGPFYTVTYNYKLTSKSIQNQYIHIKFCDFEIVNYERCYQVLDIRDINVKSIFEKICKEQIVLLAKYNGIVAGHAVLKPPQNSFSGKHWNEKALIHYCYVAPKYRGKNIYPYMLANLANIAFNEYNISKIYIFTNKKNVASQKGIRKVGYSIDEKGYELGWGGISILKFWKKQKVSMLMNDVI